MNKLIAILTVMLVLASIQIVGAETQNWHLLDDTYTGTTANDGTTHYRNFFMNKTGNSIGTYINVPNIDNTLWWYAEYGAQFDGLPIGEDDWVVNISHGPTDDCTIWADVCKVNDSGGEVTYLASGSVSNIPDTSRNSVIICKDNLTTDQIFNTSERLALRVYHNRTGSLRIYYYKLDAERFTNLSSPTSDPGYPVPELATLTLVSLGLVSLVGYAYAFRNKNG